MGFGKAKQQRRGVGIEAMSPSPKGYLVILGVFASLAIIAVILMALYREMPKPTEALDRQKRANAKYVSFVIVFGNVDQALRQRAIHEIIEDVGADTATTDFVVGSTVADPWVASIHEYRHQLHKAMTESSSIPIGKQSMIMAMVAGLVAKNDLPARIYVIGNLNDEGRTDREVAAVLNRTQQTMATLDWRNRARAPVTMYSYMDTTKSEINAQYVRILKSQSYPFFAR